MIVTPRVPTANGNAAKYPFAPSTMTRDHGFLAGGRDGKPEAMMAKINQESLAEMVCTTRLRVGFS